jgi:transposase
MVWYGLGMTTTTDTRPRRPGPQLPELSLSDEERATLQRWARRRTSSQALALRCRIVLACAEGHSNQAVADRLGVSKPTVTKWRVRFLKRRLEGLADAPRPGAARTITDEQVEQVLVTTLETTPKDATHWSTRSLARQLGMSQSAISRIWRAFGLKPHLVDTFKLSTDPQFIDKVRDVVGLYLNPPQAALVLCVDEKTGVQALDRTAPILPLLPGTPQRASHDDTRHGTTNLYAALELASGKVISQLSTRSRAVEFKRFLAHIDKQVPAGLDVHVICDNSSTHKTPAIQRWLVAHPRFQLHLTPTYSSWLNLVERFIAELTSKWLRRGTHRWVAELERSIQSWIATWNENPRPFGWTKTADEILDTIAGYCQRINDSEH